ncbi:MAG: hypothetical protein HN764_15960 [Gammaproteobacteria bacterium]|nr:hypothetical protein [Gammaproteobacteria bacterium]
MSRSHDCMDAGGRERLEQVFEDAKERRLSGDWEIERYHLQEQKPTAYRDVRM